MIGYFIVALGFMFLLQNVLTTQPVETLLYSQFKALLKDRQVTDIVVGTNEIRGAVTPDALARIFPEKRMANLGDRANHPVPFQVVRVEDADLIAELEEAGVPFKGEIAGNWFPLLLFWLLPVAIFLVFWTVLAGRMGGPGGGLMQIGKSKAKVYHESGHALVAELAPGADPVSKISIIPRGLAALGYTQQTPTEDRYLMTRSELMARIHVLLGGRVAEEMVFHDVSTGAQNDLQRATEIARTMVTQFGMSRKLGLVSLEGPRQPVFLPVPMPSVKEYSEDTARVIDAEVQKLLSEAHETVTEVLATHRVALEKLAQRLLTKEVVERAELQAILKVISIDRAKERKRQAANREGEIEEMTKE